MDKIKVNVSLVSGLILYSCMNPSEPIASLQSQLITTIDTGGKCRDIDFNDSLIIAAADTNSFQGYSYSFSNEGIFDYVHEFDDSGSVGLHEPFVANKIIMSENRKYFLLMDKNEGLFALHGTLVCLGLILYSIGSKNLPAAELTLLSLTEVIGGIFWVWIPILGINEIPTNNTIIGGFLIFMEIIYYSLVIKNNRRFIGLN